DIFKWGLVPFWAKDPSIGVRLINARSETIAQKPAFKRSFKSRRILIPANGFYEWDKTTRPRTPYFIGLEDDALFAMAGIWDEWEGAGSEKIKSCSIITTNSSELVERIHDRMPVIVRRNDYEEWLQSRPLSDSLASEIFRPFPANFMKMRPVSAKVNRVGYDAPD
ncbi:MAG: SOS response-associated peptidase, partial [Desulfomonilaceae bacterium]